ncbi:MAG: 50S ribosomal protein L25 [Simkaniaceae bacterium]|nr:50S ribosomal protein L25 [Simkaniaceae bacterium]
MKLTVSKRLKEKKSELTELRNRGDIPAVLYSANGEHENIVISGVDFEKAMRLIEKGHLPTTVFDIGSCKVIVKEIQYHPTTYQILHVDLQKIHSGVSFEVNVPIVCVGEADCVGVKLGGFLRKVKRVIKVACTPETMPTCFYLNVSSLAIGQSKRAKDIEMKPGVKTLFPLDEVIVVVAKR